MADIELVIKIPEEMYLNEVDLLCGEDILVKAIKNGTPLPKGHGDLKDQNELLTVLIKSAEAHCQNSREDALMGRVRQQILGCHAIIEADKESEDKE